MKKVAKNEIIKSCPNIFQGCFYKFLTIFHIYQNIELSNFIKVQNAPQKTPYII